MQTFFQAIDKHRLSFLCLPGVVSIGMGVKIKNNRFTGIQSLTLGVKKKLPLHAIPREQMIPKLIDHLTTDVVEVGSIQFKGFALPNPASPPDESADFRKKKIRPAQPGVSIGHYKVTAGTLGAVVSGDFPGGMAILSNNHILANGTDGRDGRSRIGDPVLQPGSVDGGSSGDTIAQLYAFSPMVPEKKGARGPFNKIDAAIASPTGQNLIKSPVLGLGPVYRTSSARPGMVVFKSGRSSGVTRGIVTSVGNTIRVENEDRQYIFEDQIGLSSASEPGDSGSLVVSQFGSAVGLLFAGSEKYTFVNPIDSVLEYFNVSLYDK